MEDLAKKLDGCKYREIPQDIAAEAKEKGLVIVSGASDDLMEFDGAVFDELDAWRGLTAYIDADSRAAYSENDYECLYGRPAGLRERKFPSIEAVWDDPAAGCSWSYKTDIPHATFKMMDDGELYCIGLVFSLADARSMEGQK